MNKKELVAAVAAKTEMTQVSVEKALKAIIEATVAEVAKKGKVQLIGFGTFEARERAARTGKNPQNGKPIKIAAATVPAFKAGKAFKEPAAEMWRAFLLTGKTAGSFQTRIILV